MAKSREEISRSRRNKLGFLVEELNEKMTDSTPKELQETLSILKEIFDNIIQHPNDDKYRQINLTSKAIISIMWRYPAAVNVMKMAGWEEDGECVIKLKDDSHARATSELLEQELRKTALLPPEDALVTNKPRFMSTYRFHEVDEDKNNIFDVSSSASECCVLTLDKMKTISAAVMLGNGGVLKELLRPYHFACLENMRFLSYSLTELACFCRQIGIARILTKEYGADFSSSNEKEVPICFAFFRRCDSTESCQSTIIEFIKEFKIDVHRRYCYYTALHFAVLHRLFAIVKFLVEDCKVDVNCANSSINDGTPLHMAYGTGEEKIAQYLIEHGADQAAFDRDGRKPADYKSILNDKSWNCYANKSKELIKDRILNNELGSTSYNYYRKLRNQGYNADDAMELTFMEFPSLQETLDSDIANINRLKNLQTTPTPKELNRYITEMAPFYHDIGLELDIPFAKLKLIKKDSTLPDLKEKCQQMLAVWLQSDASATWKKLCDALQELGMSVLAKQIKDSL